MPSSRLCGGPKSAPVPSRHPERASATSVAVSSIPSASVRRPRSRAIWRSARVSAAADCSCRKEWTKSQGMRKPARGNVLSAAILRGVKTGSRTTIPISRWVKAEKRVCAFVAVIASMGRSSQSRLRNFALRASSRSMPSQASGSSSAGLGKPTRTKESSGRWSSQVEASSRLMWARRRSTPARSAAAASSGPLSQSPAGVDQRGTTSKPTSLPLWSSTRGTPTKSIWAWLTASCKDWVSVSSRWASSTRPEW